jgi:hypothetical protein
MDAQLRAEIDALRGLNGAKLRRKHAEVFGDSLGRSMSREQALRRIAWRLQARAEGGLSERARQRASELADGSTLRLSPPPSFSVPLAPTLGQGDATPARSARDRRLPPPGSTLAREFRGQQIVVEVLPEGFDYRGRVFRSLSAIAREVSGAVWNGFVFFGLQK